MTAHRITTTEERDEMVGMIRRHSQDAASRRERSDSRKPDSTGTRFADPTPRHDETGALLDTSKGNPVDPELTAEAATALVHLINSPVSATPMLASEAQVHDFENSWRTTESVVERFYEQWPELRWFDLCAPADDSLRRIANDAAEAFKLATAPGIPAIVATCRPGEPWVMNEPADFHTVCDEIEGEIWCDLQITGPQIIGGKRYASCVEWFQSVTAPKPPNRDCDERFNEILRKDRERYDGELIAKSFTTLPVARGDLIVLARACSWCLGAFMAQNSIDPKECAIEERHSDGFGEVPWKAIPEPTANGTANVPPELIYESDVEDDQDDDL
jgi:hypothetical protein